MWLGGVNLWVVALCNFRVVTVSNLNQLETVRLSCSQQWLPCATYCSSSPLLPSSPLSSSYEYNTFKRSRCTLNWALVVWTAIDAHLHRCTEINLFIHYNSCWIKCKPNEGLRTLWGPTHITMILARSTVFPLCLWKYEGNQNEYISRENVRRKCFPHTWHDPVPLGNQ